MVQLRRVCVFCGSNPGALPQYCHAAQELGQELVQRGLGLVYGGSGSGCMGALADAVLAAGGEVVGVIPQSLVDMERVHSTLPELRVVRSMHQRKALMADLADAFVALPGGMGTLEEICEVITWAQLGMHKKPCGLLDVAGYYSSLRGFLDHMSEQQFMKSEHRAMILSADSPAALLDRFERYSPPAVDKWFATMPKNGAGVRRP